TDAGLTWALQLQLDDYNYFKAIYFADPQHGWIVGRKGLVYATTDGGGMGISEMDVSDQLLLYPNPSDGSFTLKLRENLTKGEPFLIEIFSLSGHLVFRDSNPLQEDYQINLGGSSGAAVLRISQGRMTGSRRIIFP
ncbi:MAG TPA: T9SS type A sorting domain-containing protein, partial [Bacteroidales bacterium]|nr:T9SS type A sorting domain-containing protein [Bacteroidales bacterium]